MLRRTPDEVAAVLDGRADLATRPGPDEWSIAELVGHLIETDSAFRSRVHDRARQQRRTGARLPPAVDLARRQGLGTHVGGRAPVCVPRYPGRDDCARRGPHRHHTDTDWMRKGTVRGTGNSGPVPQSRHATSSRTPANFSQRTMSCIAAPQLLLEQLGRVLTQLLIPSRCVGYSFQHFLRVVQLYGRPAVNDA